MMNDSRANTRERVCTACDRCRIKKSKCDGTRPCRRCEANNKICAFSEKKKPLDKMYPKGYVELLEQQQTQLVAGLQVLYTRLQGGHGWPGAPLCELKGGHPLTHSILERLDLLHQYKTGSSNHEEMTNDRKQTPRKTTNRYAQHSFHQGSIRSATDCVQTSSHSQDHGAPNREPSAFSNLFAFNNSLSSPHLGSHHPRQSEIVPLVGRDTLLPSLALEDGLSWTESIKGELFLFDAEPMFAFATCSSV